MQNPTLLKQDDTTMMPELANSFALWTFIKTGNKANPDKNSQIMKSE